MTSQKYYLHYDACISPVLACTGDAITETIFIVILTSFMFHCLHIQIGALQPL